MSVNRIKRLVRMKKEIESLATPLRDPEPLRQVVQELIRLLYLEELQDIAEQEAILDEVHPAWRKTVKVQR